jgi:hypothetical protein
MALYGYGLEYHLPQREREREMWGEKEERVKTHFTPFMRRAPAYS